MRGLHFLAVVFAATIDCLASDLETDEGVYILYASYKKLPRKMKACLVIIECAGYIFWQLILRRLKYTLQYVNIFCNILYQIITVNIVGIIHSNLRVNTQRQSSDRYASKCKGMRSNFIKARIEVIAVDGKI